jgi:hypothetical protein
MIKVYSQDQVSENPVRNSRSCWVTMLVGILAVICVRLQ